MRFLKDGRKVTRSRFVLELPKIGEIIITGWRMSWLEATWSMSKRRLQRGTRILKLFGEMRLGFTIAGYL